MEGLCELYPLENSSRKRANVTVYDVNKTQVLLQVEVQSSPMRECVMKSIYGAADILRLLQFFGVYHFCISEVW